LGTAVEASEQTITSAHLHFDAAVVGQHITADGNETVSAGVASTLDITEQASGQTVQLLCLEDGVFIRLPAVLNPGAKPWIRASADSQNEIVQQLYGSVGELEAEVAPHALLTYVAAATSAVRDGPEIVNDTPVTHYSLIADLTQLPNSSSSDPTDAHVELWLDDQNRAVKYSLTASLDGVTTTTTLTLGNFNAPVTIAAPPADQVSTD
jgi:hypothetical protein